MNVPILDNKDIKIIYLLKEQNFVSIKKLSQELDVSERSIRNYIKRINEELLGSATIEISRTKGAYISIVDKDKFNKLLSEYANNNVTLNDKEDRIKYIVNYFVELDGTTTLDELAYELNIGKTTLVNDMREVEKILLDYDCKIISKKNIGSYLDYNEIDLRLLILNYCCLGQSIESINNKYLKLSDKQLTNLVNKVYTTLEEINYNITKQVLHDIIKHILILVYRVQKGYLINHIEKKHAVITNVDRFSDYTEKMSEIILDVFDITINDNGKLYLSIPFLTRNASINETLSFEELDSLIAGTMDDIWIKIYKEMGVVVKDKFILKNLATHLSYSLNRMIFNVKVTNPLKNEIKKKYNFAYRLSQISAKVIEDKIGVTVSDDEISFIAMHFSALLENNKLKINELSSFALVCENGLGTSVLLKARLKRILNPNSKIDIYSAYDFRNIDYSKYQIIFTTINIDLENLMDISIPVIKIDNIFDEQELRSLIENTFYHHEKIEQDSFLLQFINDKNINFYNSDDYKVILSDMIDRMIEVGEVDATFKKYILEREETNPTISNNGVMLPHYVSNLITKPVIALGIVKGECYHNNKLLKLVILIAYPKDNVVDTDLLIKVYDDILELGQNTEVFNELINSTYTQEVKKIIRRR